MVNVDAHDEVNLPSDDFGSEVEWGSVKAVKTDNKRSDSMLSIDPNKVRVIEGFNVRVRDESYLAYIRELADSMKESGYHIDKPISVIVQKVDGQDTLFVVNGHSRLEASKLAISEGADFDVISAIIHSRATNMDDMIVDLIRSNSGRHLSAYEMSIVCKRLANREFTEAEIARRTGLSPGYVNGLLLLAQAPNRVVKLILAGTVSASVVIEEIRARGVTAATNRLVRVAEAAFDETTGKQGKVTSKSMPGAKFKSELKKNANKLYERAIQIKADPGYAALSDDNKKALDELLSDLEKNKPDDEAPEA